MIFTCFASAFVPFGTLLMLLSAATGMAQEQSGRPISRYFPLVRVSPTLRPYVVASGERLQKPGAERIRLAGTIQYGADGQNQTAPVQITLQLPAQVRIELNAGAIVYDGKNAPQRVPSSQRELDAVETLVEDSLEGLLRIKASGGSTRLIAAGIRDVSTFVDILYLTYASQIRGGAKQSKTFYFDSSTKMMSRVEYQPRSNVRLDVGFSDWRTVQGVKFPHLIERRENGALTMRLVFAAAEVSESTDESAFIGQQR